MLPFKHLPVKVFQAFKYAAEKHLGQVRKKSDIEYISHPFNALLLLSKYKDSKNNEDLMCAILLHDTIEDTTATYEEIKEKFGELVANIVKELTSNEEEIARIGKVEHLKEKMCIMSSYALTLKLIDRLANLMDGPQFKTYAETLEIIQYIKDNRKDLSKTQLLIMSDIVQFCNEKIKEHKLEEKINKNKDNIKIIEDILNKNGFKIRTYNEQSNQIFYTKEVKKNNDNIDLVCFSSIINEDCDAGNLQILYNYGENWNTNDFDSHINIEHEEWTNLLEYAGINKKDIEDIKKAVKDSKSNEVINNETEIISKITKSMSRKR